MIIQLPKPGHYENDCVLPLSQMIEFCVIPNTAHEILCIRPFLISDFSVSKKTLKKHFNRGFIHVFAYVSFETEPLRDSNVPPIILN